LSCSLRNSLPSPSLDTLTGGLRPSRPPRPHPARLQGRRNSLDAAGGTHIASQT